MRISYSDAAFALEEAAGETSDSGEFFLVVDGQRKKVRAGFGFRVGDHGGEQHGIAHAQRRIRRPAWPTSRFDRDPYAIAESNSLIIAICRHSTALCLVKTEKANHPGCLFPESEDL